GIGENALRRYREVRDHRLHARRIVVADAGDLDVGVLMAFAQQIAHVHVIEAQADDFEFFHGADADLEGKPGTVQRSPARNTAHGWPSRAHSAANGAGDAVLNSNIS